MFGWLFGLNDNDDSKNDKRIKNQGVFGIDWDGDEEVTDFDDLMTMDILSDE